MTPSRIDTLALGRVLVALGRSRDAEDVVLTALETKPDDMAHLSLLAKVKHLRGELSQAIALWATVYSRSRNVNIAQQQLAALRHLAEDPERGAAEFIAIGDGLMIKKHLSQIELERAFRLLRDGKVADAESVCEGVARRSRDRDRDVYKLACLARAWIRELTGDLNGARRALEALGEERGFETDTDRLLFLVRVLERLGRPDDVRAAIKVYRYLQRNFEKLTAPAHLARLYRMVGDAASAAESDRAYLVAFRRRMHKPTQTDLVRAAAARYIPLETLRALETVEPEPGDAPDDALCAAIREALFGDADEADARLASQGAMGAAYRGDLRAARGEVAEAAAFWGDALRDWEDAIDSALVARLCDSPDGAAVLSRLEGDRTWTESALACMLDAARRSPGDSAPWRRLSILERAAGRSEDAERHSAKAAALESAEPHRRRPGRVLAAAAYRFVGKTKGLIHELWADRRPTAPGRGGILEAAELHGNLAPDLADSVRSTFLSTREYARHKFPHLARDIDDYTYSFKVTKEDEPSGGLSAGLPTAVAFLSLFVGRPVPDNVALSGALVADAHNVLAVRRVGDIEAKVKGAYNRDLAALVLPAESRAEVMQSIMVPREVSTQLVRYARTIDDALEHLFGKSVWDW